MATTEILFHDRDVSGWISAVGHYHSVSIDTINTRFVQVFGRSNAKLTSVKLRVKCYTQAKSFIGNNCHIDVAAYLCPSNDAFTGTRLMFHEDIAQIKHNATANDSNAGTYESDNLVDYFINLGSTIQEGGRLYNINTTQPRMSVCYITDNIASRKMYCIEMKFIVEYEIQPTLTINLDANGGEVSNTSISNKLIGDLIDTLPTPTKTHYIFDHWIDSSNNTIITYPFIITKNMNLQAHWTGKPVIVSCRTGTYRPGNVDGTCSTSGTGDYRYGDLVTITAYDFTNHTQFENWMCFQYEGSIYKPFDLSFENPYSFIIDETLFEKPDDYRISISAKIKGEDCYFTVHSDPPEAGYIQKYNEEIIDPNKKYLGEYGGSTSTLWARPNDGYEFSHWQDNSTSNPTTFTLFETDITYTAYFKQTKINNFLLDFEKLSKILLEKNSIKGIYIDNKKLL